MIQRVIVEGSDGFIFERHGDLYQGLALLSAVLSLSALDLPVWTTGELNDVYVMFIPLAALKALRSVGKVREYRLVHPRDVMVCLDDIDLDDLDNDDDVKGGREQECKSGREVQMDVPDATIANEDRWTKFGANQQAEAYCSTVYTHTNENSENGANRSREHSVVAGAVSASTGTGGGGGLTGRSLVSESGPDSKLRRSIRTRRR